MSPEERQLLAGLFDRTRGMGSAPRDRDAEAFIADAVRSQPYAPYLLAQSVIVQEQALRAANDRLQELEAKVADLEQRGQAPSGGGFLSGLGGLFGGGAPQQPPPQQPRPQGPWGGGNVAPSAPAWGGGQSGFQGGAPGYGGMQGGGMGGGMAPPPAGGGFLHGALGAAAGVAGGVLLADSIRGLFGGHNNPMGIASGVPGFGGGSGLGGGETIVNNYYGNDSSTQQHAQDVLQDQDQDQDLLQDASDDTDYSSDDSSQDV